MCEGKRRIIAMTAAITLRRLTAYRRSRTRTTILAKPLALGDEPRAQNRDLRIEECLDEQVQRYVRTACLFDTHSVIYSESKNSLHDCKPLISLVTAARQRTHLRVVRIACPSELTQT
jgi:hypothetical protein